MKIFILIISIFSVFSTISFAQKKAVSKRLLNETQTNQIDTPVKILYKPRAAYPMPNEGTVCIQGTVTLRVEFLDSGTIGKIFVISGLPYGATENAIKAAQEVKYKPARKNGKPITVFKQVQFSFSIY